MHVLKLYGMERFLCEDNSQKIFTESLSATSTQVRRVALLYTHMESERDGLGMNICSICFYLQSIMSACLSVCPFVCHSLSISLFVFTHSSFCCLEFVKEMSSEVAVTVFASQGGPELSLPPHFQVQYCGEKSTLIHNNMHMSLKQRLFLASLFLSSAITGLFAHQQSTAALLLSHICIHTPLHTHTHSHNDTLTQRTP